MTIETAEQILFSMRQLESLPESGERERAISALRDKVRVSLTSGIASYALIGKAVGWELVEEVFEDSLSIIRKMKERERE